MLGFVEGWNYSQIDKKKICRGGKKSLFASQFDL